GAPRAPGLLKEGRDHAPATIAEDAKQRSLRLGTKHAFELAYGLEEAVRWSGKGIFDERAAGRALLELGGRVELEELAAIDDGDPIAELVRLLHVMRRHENIGPFAASRDT